MRLYICPLPLLRAIGEKTKGRVNELNKNTAQVVISCTNYLETTNMAWQRWEEK